jgi:hypothetical protein
MGDKSPKKDKSKTAAKSLKEKRASKNEKRRGAIEGLSNPR